MMLATALTTAHIYFTVTDRKQYLNVDRGNGLLPLGRFEVCQLNGFTVIDDRDILSKHAGRRRALLMKAATATPAVSLLLGASTPAQAATYGDAGTTATNPVIFTTTAAPIFTTAAPTTVSTAVTPTFSPTFTTTAATTRASTTTVTFVPTFTTTAATTRATTTLPP